MPWREKPWREQTPGEWPDISERSDYQRLVSLARRRLVGFEQHAEDVVSLAMMKWARISADRRGIARIEQVIKTEAFSFLRSERRARERDTRAVADRSSALSPDARPHTDQEAAVLLRILLETSRDEGISITALDIEVLHLLLSGYKAAEIVRRTRFSRHQVRTSRQKWQVVLKKAGLEPAPDRSSAPR